MTARRRTRHWPAAFGGFALALALALSRPLAASVLEGDDLPWLTTALAMPVVVGVPIAAFMLAMAWTRRRLFVSYALSAALGAVVYVVSELPMYLRDVGDDTELGTLAIAFLGAYNSLLVVGVWALVYVMPVAARAERDREREHAELRRAAEQARLRAALEPHFVLNTLNAIAGLVHEDPDQARERIGDLGDLLRDVVRLSDRARHALDDEVRWLERYTRILAARHEGRLEVRWDIEPASRAATVPVLVLQPLVENAIQHGALQRPAGGRIEIATRIADRRLSCTIADNGPGLPAEVRPDAQGLALTRRRLAAEWPGATLTIASTGTGTRVELAWPEEQA